MAVNHVIYMNECGLPLNSIEWLETHHRSKAPERTQMIRDLHLERGSLVVDAGCGPGLWTPMLARAIGPLGRITGVDISTEALITAQPRQVVRRAVTTQASSPGAIANPTWNRAHDI
jgi:trans-aconitate methyltransferase